MTDTDYLPEAGRQFFAKIPFRSLLAIAVAFIILFILSVVFFTEYIRPYEYGVRINRIGLDRGIQRTPLQSGKRHFVIPYLQAIEKLPKSVQVLEMSVSTNSTSNYATQIPAAHIQTSDGFYVDVDVSILYSIEDPYLVATSLGFGELFIENGIVPRAEPDLKATLGTLNTEDFYNSPLRVQKTRDAAELLNSELNPKGIRVHGVYVRKFKYDDKIQENIETKKLRDQQKLTNIAKANAKEEEALVTETREIGEQNVKVMLEEGQAYVTEKEGEIAEYSRTKHAEGDLLVALAKAQGEKAVNASLNGLGAEQMVKLEMTKVLRGLDTLILPSDGENGVNPLNVDKTLEMFSK